MTELEKLHYEYLDNYNFYTYGHYRDPENANVLQVGLVACFSIDKGYLSEKRQAIAEVLAIYDSLWGNKLKWGYQDGNPNALEPYEKTTIQQKVDYIAAIGDDNLNYYWGNIPNLEYVPDYMILVYSRACWYEQVHKSVTYLQLYVPISTLTEYGVQAWIELIKRVSQKLEPMHGYAGLGLQHSHEFYNYQYLEYQIAHQFRGLDIICEDDDINYRNGFKCINWLTIIGDELLNSKLGSTEQLQNKNKDKVVRFHSFDGGVLIQAGEVPALGYIHDDPYPEHYVAANQRLKPARAPEIGSLGFGSVAGEIRFNDKTTMEWQTRFDNPPPEKAVIENPSKKSIEPLSFDGQKKRITVKTGELCQFSGLYSTLINGVIYYQEFVQGYIIKPYTLQESGRVYSEVIWVLLRRDDVGDPLVTL